MNSPNYNDISKKVKDLFEKNFPAGFIKLIAKFPTTNDITVSINGSQNIDSGKLTSSLETKLNVNLARRDLIFTEKWTVSNEVQSNLELNPITNLKTNIEFNYEPSSGRKSLKLKNNYANDLLNLSGDIECRQIEPIVTLSTMIRFLRSTPFYGGALLSFDSYKGKMTKIGYGFQFDNKETSVTTSLTNHNDVLLQVYKKLQNKTEVGLEGAWHFESKAYEYGMAIKQYFENDSSLKTKVESNGSVSLGFTFPVRDGVKLTFGAKFDAKNFNSGGHKFGIEFEI